MEPLVRNDRCDDHGVGEQDETAKERAHHLDENELGLVPFIVSAAVVIEKAHGLVVMAGEVLPRHFFYTKQNNVKI